MAAFSVVANTDGNFSIHSEHGDSDAAIMEFHNYARALRGDSGTKKYTIKILDAQLDVFNGYSETLDRNPIEE